ncbi:MAG TPA: D-amino acid dehydrogenase [Steroidobacter sp.]|uniref:D-amino acid dehydrogenase n=1 Tax=Steroidobacter sp. TaxID=1978227 RepID=UPI002ED88AB9
MKIVIVGCGLIGVTTAYSLRQRGHDVTVLERAEGPAREASFANGGMLTAGMCQPWNGPGSWRILLRSLVRSDTALQLRLSVLPRLMRWGTCFLRNSTAAAFERNCRSNLRLALHSLEAMHALREQAQVEFGRAARGSLGVFRDREAWRSACRETVQLFSDGLVARRLTVAELVELEPALRPIAHKLSGAIHYLSDEVGDAQRFCEALAKVARALGVDFRFGSNVRGLEMHRGRVAAVITENERFVADRYVIAAGAYSTALLKDAGIRLPVQPAKGYSVTFKEANSIVGLRRPMIDHDLHAVLVPFEDGSVRTAGTAEFAGFDSSLKPARVRNLLALTRELLPEAQLNEGSAIPWCGLRPSSPDGVAIIGATPVENLWVNSGHGHLGWTLAAGSARLFTSLLSGDAPDIDPNPYSLKRFS